MAISQARRNFRRALYGLLAFSVVFMGTMGGLRLYVKQDRSRYHIIAPYLFHFDAMQMSARSYFMNDDDKFTMGSKLYSYNYQYRKYGVEIIDELIAEGYAPAQVFKANVLIRLYGSPEARAEALSLYQMAAEQNYEPAQIQLALLKKVVP